MSEPLEVVLCMGSSCFSRGNVANLEAIRRHLDERGVPLRVTLRGHLCEGRCKEGPHLVVDGRLHARVTPASARALVDQALAARAAS